VVCRHIIPPRAHGCRTLFQVLSHMPSESKRPELQTTMGCEKLSKRFQPRATLPFRSRAEMRIDTYNCSIRPRSNVLTQTRDSMGSPHASQCRMTLLGLTERYEGVVSPYPPRFIRKSAPPACRQATMHYWRCTSFAC
jgi:hypothetical protein